MTQEALHPRGADKDSPRSALRAARLRRFSRITAGIALAIALITLVLGWILQIEGVFRHAPDLPVMVPATATAVALLALYLVVPATFPRIDALRIACALAVLGICGWSVLSGRIFAQGDRLSPATAVLLTLAAVVSLIPPSRIERIWLSTAGLILALFALASWILDLSATQSVTLLTGLSLPTAISLSLIFAASVTRSPHRGWIGLAVSDGIGSRTARTVLPMTALLPLLASWFAIILTRRGLLPTSLALTAGATVLTLVAATLVMRLARAQNHEERAARQAGMQVAQLLEAVPVAIFVFDGAGHVIKTNTSARALAAPAGGPAAWLRDTRFVDPTTRRALEQAERPLETLLQPGAGAASMLAGYLDERARLRVLQFRSEPLDPEVGMGAFVLTAADQSDSLALQDQLASARRREAVGELAGGMAHEMANILGVIRLAADAGLLQNDPGPMRQALDTTRIACQRGSDLTNRLLAFGGQPGKGTAAADARDLLTSALRLIRFSVPPQITLDVDLPEDGLGAIARGTDLQTAVLNLVMNARNALLEAGRASGRIAVSARREGDSLVVSVQDDGPGMSGAVLDRATEPFFTTRQDRGGSGLGLSLTAALARDTGGDLQIASQPGQGTRVVLSLPLNAAEPVPDEDTVAPPDRDTIAGHRVLVVEDDEQFRAMMVEALRFMGLEVTQTATADAALDRLDGETRFDLMITDIRLGGAIDGHRLAALAQERQAALPVLYMSGLTESHVPPERVVPGVVLRKPSSIDALRRAVGLSIRA